MTVEWVVLKFIRDLRRQEPENVGVILLSESGARLRVRGIGPQGRVSSQSLRWAGDATNLEQWFRYWEWRVAQPKTTASDLLHERAGDNYLVTYGGQLVLGEDRDPDAFVDELYQTLVARPGEGHQVFERQVDNLVRASGLMKDNHFRVNWRTTTRLGETVDFPYAWVDGHVTVGKVLPTLRLDQVRATLWLFTNIPHVNKLVFTGVVPTHRSKAAEILEEQASLVVVPEADPGEVREKFLAKSLS
jgi:hypothetical protein